VFYRPEPRAAPEGSFLAVSALVPYKRLDLAIGAAARTKTPLTIVGRGPEEGRLRQVAGATGASVTFTGWLKDEEIRTLYQRCRAAVMPGVEDFGMVPVEAQACGRPVIALAQGGALESVVDGVTGILVTEPDVDAFAAAMSACSTHPFDSATIRRHAESFGKARFQSAIRDVVADVSSHPTEPSNAATQAQRRHDTAARENTP